MMSPVTMKSLSSGYRYAGLKFAKSESALRIPRSPASGLFSGGSLYHGDVDVLPPIEPIRTASEDLAISMVSWVSGTPYLSIEHPPISTSVKIISCPYTLATLSRTFFASATISGPIPSPGMLVMFSFNVISPFRFRKS